MRQSDEDHFAAFVAANSATLFRTAYLMTGDYQRAEDLLQTTLVRVYQRWTRVEAMDVPSPTPARCWSTRRPRGGAAAPRTSCRCSLRDERSWDGRLDDVAEHERVWAAVLSLPPRQRAVTVLKYYEDLSEAEIAATLDMAPGTVKSHGHAAARRLALCCSPSPPIGPALPSGPAREVTP